LSAREIENNETLHPENLQHANIPDLTFAMLGDAGKGELKQSNY